MNISTDFQHIHPAENKPPGSYEWWYFDALSADGESGMVIIFYHANPFSVNYIKELSDNNIKTSSYPAVSVSLYEKGKTVYYSFLEFTEEDFNWDEDSPACSIGKNSFRYRQDNHMLHAELNLNQELASGHRLNGSVHFKAGSLSSELLNMKGEKHHSWNLIMPGAETECRFRLNAGSNDERIFAFTGTGYHDHNTGLEPMKDSFTDWYWGRYHFPEHTLIYYLMNRDDGMQYEGWLTDAGGNSIRAELKDLKSNDRTLNPFGLYAARKFTMDFGSAEITVQTPELLDNGPFYQRFKGNAVMKSAGKVAAARGISEYIVPGRIYSKKFWPLIEMRLRYMYRKPHWVQKSRILYPWTW